VLNDNRESIAVHGYEQKEFDMKHTGIVIAVLAIVISIVTFAYQMGLSSSQRQLLTYQKQVNVQSYDPNDSIYVLLPTANKVWIDRFGDNERTRIMYNLVQMRTALIQHAEKIRDLDIKSRMIDANEVTK